MTETQTHEEAFIGFLSKLHRDENRAALAALRRGLGKPVGAAPQMFPYLVPWVPSSPSRSREEAFYLVASLFAWHPHGWTGDARDTNLGASFAILARDRGGTSVERRFVALLGCDREDLPEHLRQTIGLLRASDVPVNWSALLHDLQRWGWESRMVQRAWASRFWGRVRSSDAAGMPDTGSDVATDDEA
jgi:CRISPR system Cascade subunit CasB